MKFVAWENGRNPEETYPNYDLSSTKPTWSDLRREFGIPAVGGEFLTACVMDPPFMDLFIYLFPNNNLIQIKLYNLALP